MRPYFLNYLAHIALRHYFRFYYLRPFFPRNVFAYLANHRISGPLTLYGASYPLDNFDHDYQHRNRNRRLFVLIRN